MNKLRPGPTSPHLATHSSWDPLSGLPPNVLRRSSSPPVPRNRCQMPEITALQADDWRPSSLFGKMKIAFCSSKLFIYQCQHCSQNDPRVTCYLWHSVLPYVFNFPIFQSWSNKTGTLGLDVFCVCLLLSVVELCAVCTQFSQRACGLHTELVNSGRVSEITQDSVSSR